MRNKKQPTISGLLYIHHISILLLFDYSLRLAPSVTGVAVASQILCISTTLNKRKYNLIYLSLYGIISPSYNPVKSFLTKAGIRYLRTPLLTYYFQLTFSLNFWISFSLETFSISAPSSLNFSSNRSYPR